MRMAELSAESGVQIATIKYYLREGLLPPGLRTSPNQAQYDQSHVRRLKLVRALLDVGGLSIAVAREVLDGIDTRTDTHRVLEITQRGLALRQVEIDERAHAWAVSLLHHVAEEHDWTLKPGDPVVEAAVGTLGVFVSLGRTELLERLDEYATLADKIAELDLDGLRELTGQEVIIEAAVVGTVLGDALFAALRRLAQQHASARRFQSRPPLGALTSGPTTFLE